MDILVSANFVKQLVNFHNNINPYEEFKVP